MPPPAELEPLPYQTRMVRFLEEEEADLWEWYSSKKFLAEYAEAVRLEILKSAYRLDRGTHGPLHALGDEALARLGLSVPLTIYQSQLESSLNAAISYLPGEAHLILSGPLLSILSPTETSWVLGHELAHFLLLEGWAGKHLVAGQILAALAAHPAAEPSQVESERLFRLYGEIFCDRGALRVAGDPLTAVSALVKLHTGLAEVSAESYLRQAEEILSRDSSKTGGMSHPELHIRARAIALWTERGRDADAEVARLIEGRPGLDDLDLLAQRRLTDLTRDVIRAHLAPAWMRTGPIRAHARLFFADLEPGAEGAAPTLPAPALVETGPLDPSVESYLAYLLFDFAAVDPDLGDVALAASILTSRRLGLEDRFLSVAGRELGLKKKALEKAAAQAEAVVGKAGAAR